MFHQFIAIISLSSVTMLVIYIVELVMGKFKKLSIGDIMLDFSTAILPDFVINPAIVLIVAGVMSTFLPGQAGMLANAPIWLQFGAFLVFEDMINYWFHRAAHAFPKLMWAIHMPHHASPYMSATMSRRNSLLYIFMFPNRYFAAALVFLGFGPTFVCYSVIKNFVLTAAHSEIRWDSFLYRHKILAPLAWIIERTISTPATHFAHHALSEDDGIGCFNGNYSNLLFFWDVLFGTALITRQYPPAFGVMVEPGQEPMPWYAQLLFPLGQSKTKNVQLKIAQSA